MSSKISTTLVKTSISFISFAILFLNVNIILDIHYHQPYKYCNSWQERASLAERRNYKKRIKNEIDTTSTFWAECMVPPAKWLLCFIWYSSRLNLQRFSNKERERWLLFPGNTFVSENWWIQCNSKELSTRLKSS